MHESLNEMLDADPFKPFKIVTTSGHAYEVSNPHLLAIGQTMLSYYYPRSDRSAQIRLNQIVAIETLEQAA